VKITRKSLISGVERTVDLPVTPEQMAAWEGGAHIQHAMPNLSADQREFILTGITAEEWDATFAEGEEAA
jgi:hypothetical protein